MIAFGPTGLRTAPQALENPGRIKFNPGWQQFAGFL
jgi:hypothetical protein